MTSTGEGMPSKERVAGVGHHGRLAVHESVGPDHPAPECFADGLVSQADAEDGHYARGRPDQRDRDAGLARRARARER